MQLELKTLKYTKGKVENYYIDTLEKCLRKQKKLEKLNFKTEILKK